MAVARHSDDIEVQDEDDTIYDDIEVQDEDDTIYENETTVTARRTNVEMSEEGHYERLDLQKIDDAVYEDLRTKKKQSGRRPFRVVSGCLGMLCLISFGVNIVQAVHFNKNLTLENTQLKSAYTNLTLENTQLKSAYTNLTLENTQLQSANKNLTLELNCQIAESCPCGWKKFGSSCYYRTTGGTTWQEGREECLNQGADLVVISSGEEQDFIRGLNPGGYASWIGLNRTEGRWTWVDGTSMKTQYWAIGEPTNNEDRNCAAYWHWTHTGCSNLRCSSTWPSICEK